MKIRRTPFVRDVFLAYLTKGSRRTMIDEYPIIESWMVAKEPPKEIIQWDRRWDAKDLEHTAICFYCNDYRFTPILSNPKHYLQKINRYQSAVGIDPSPYDDMQIVVQKSQIFLNLAITYFFGANGIKIIPNVRLGDERTLGCLSAFPHRSLIAIGTNGFMKRKANREVFKNQISKIVDELEPAGICVYGPLNKYVFDRALQKGIPLFQYDSYTTKRAKELHQ